MFDNKQVLNTTQLDFIPEWTIKDAPKLLKFDGSTILIRPSNILRIEFYEDINGFHNQLFIRCTDGKSLIFYGVDADFVREIESKLWPPAS